MATKNWNNDFMAKVLEEAAWKELSSEFAWNEQLLEKYKDKVVWKKISGNSNILWTVSMIEKFKNKADWEELSGSDNEYLFTAENLEKYKDYWNWRELSRNSNVELTPTLLEQFVEYWDWNEIIDCYHRDELYSMEFLEKYQDYIPASALQRSRLWDKLVEDEKKQLKIRILLDVCREAKDIIKQLRCYREQKETKRLNASIGSLGGGNHFIELDKDECGITYLVVHTGLGTGRNLAGCLLIQNRVLLQKDEEEFRFFIVSLYDTACIDCLLSCIV